MTTPTPTLREMFRRLLRAQGQSRAARTVEAFGWLDLVLGLILVFAPHRVESLLQLPALTPQGAGYLRLAGLLVSGLGMLYVVSGRLNAEGFVFASLLDRPLSPLAMAVLWYKQMLPGSLALAFALSDFGGFLWTLWAWKRDVRLGPDTARPRLGARLTAGFFAFAGGVVRNSRIFHPDGRVFLGTVRSLDPTDPSLARAAGELAGSTVLLRMGMGLMKRGWPRWLADHVPDAPSIAARFFSAASPGEVRLVRRPGEDLDLLCTAGGDRLWKLVLNLMTGGKGFGLRHFDYFQNLYYAQVPYRIDGGKEDVWLRFVPAPEPGSPADGPGREEKLTKAVAAHAVVRIEAQRTGDAQAPFVPFAEFRFEQEIEVDQEALHFDPITGRGFAPHGLLTDARRSVYPASVQSRGASRQERARREDESILTRLGRYLQLGPSPVLADDEEGSPAMSTPTGAAAPAPRWRRWLKTAFLLVLAVVVLLVLYLAVRFTGDRPVDYANDVDHWKYGSTGGERMSGFPYWIWVALPELFPELLPDKQPGHGYASFGMIYEPGKDPRYDLPVGVARRKFMGIDRVFVNCAVCHTGSVRDAPGAPPRIIAGMPANTFDIGAFEQFLMSVPVSEKFTASTVLGQIRKMERAPHREVVPADDFLNHTLLQLAGVSLMRDRLLMIRNRLLFIEPLTAGPGRVDTFNNPKALLNFPTDHIPREQLHGNVDFPSVWNQRPREGMQLHWDGNNTSVDERNLSAAFGTGAYPPTLDADRVLRTSAWLKDVAKPPDYPYPFDRALAAQGAPLYQEYCAGCHGTREAPYRHNPPQPDERVGTVVPIEKIGTDRHRFDSYTETLAVNQSTLYAGYEKDWGFKPDYPHRFTHFKKTKGYANSPLDGIWLRAPYLHNGSVPNLRELLEPTAARTKLFYRGDDVYDPQNVGFVSNVPEREGRKFFLFDIHQDGNDNRGHEGKPYGTDLPPGQKRALLEYLKTF